MAGKKRSDDDSRWIWEAAPAPGELRAVHALVKTAEGRERLSSPGALSDWLVLWGLMPAPVELDKNDLERALEVRGALRELIAAKRGAPADEAAARLNRALASTSYRLHVRAGAGMRYEPRAECIDGALARLLAIVERAQEGSWRRLKRCQDEDCDRIYHDFSRSICGKWCSKRCGNKLSARGYRRRYKHLHGVTPGARRRRS